MTLPAFHPTLMRRLTGSSRTVLADDHPCGSAALPASTACASPDDATHVRSAHRRWSRRPVDVFPLPPGSSVASGLIHWANLRPAPPGATRRHGFLPRRLRRLPRATTKPRRHVLRSRYGLTVRSGRLSRPRFIAHEGRSDAARNQRKGETP